MRSVRRVACSLALLVAALPAQVFAEDVEPEIIGVEYETRISGAGVVSAEDDVDPRAAAVDAAAQESAAESTERAALALGRARAAQAAAGPGGEAGSLPGFVEENDLRVVDVRRASDPNAALVATLDSTGRRRSFEEPLRLPTDADVLPMTFGEVPRRLSAAKPAYGELLSLAAAALGFPATEFDAGFRISVKDPPQLSTLSLRWLLAGA